MRDLRLRLNPIAFDELVELGRSIIPSVAPEWTDHNVHDPGIMMIELLAWIADAQVYSLSRSRRDERRAYAHLLGVDFAGPQPARGLIWPGVAVTAGHRLPARTRVTATASHPQAPAFFTTDEIDLTAAALTRVESVFAGGGRRDWTAANTQADATFMPFGSDPAPGDRLVLTLEGRLFATLPGTLAIGVEIAAGTASTPPAAGPDDKPLRRAALRVTVAGPSGPRRVTVTRDGTDGLLHSGVLLLRIDDDPAPDAGALAVSIASASGGFRRPPRLRRIALNVLPVEQVEQVPEEEPRFGTGLPDQTYRLRNSGLMFPSDDVVRAHLFEGAASYEWKAVPRLDDEGPDARVFVLDPAEGRLQFGNGLNGRVPAEGSPLQVRYAATDGVRGNLPKGLDWSVEGIFGVFGSNSEPMTGGAPARTLEDLRRLARERSRTVRPIVTASDLEEAARALPELAVRRAHEIATVRTRDVAGTRLLVAVETRDAGAAPERTSEAWLDAIHARLALRLPVGQRLHVMPPRYVDVRITATLTAVPQARLEDVRARVEQTLRQRLAIVATPPETQQWPLGRDLTRLMVLGWLRSVEGVARVKALDLFAAGTSTQKIALGPIALPRLQLSSGDIVVERPPLGAGR